MWGDGQSGGDWDRGGEGGIGTCTDAVEGRRTNTSDGDGDQGERTRRGSYPYGKPHKHTVGHTAVAEEGGSAGPYLEASLNRRWGLYRLILVLLQETRGRNQRQVRDLGDLKLAVTDFFGGK